MGQLVRVLALRHFCRLPIRLIALFLITGWCRATDVPSAEGEKSSLAMEDPGSQDRAVRWIHPKSPLLTGDVPLNSTKYTLELEQGDWSVVIENDTSDAEIRALMRHICEEGGESHPTAHASYFASKFIAIKHGYQRTNNWFELSDALEVFDKYLANLIVSAADRPVNVLEIGSFEGGSALWVAEHLLLHPDSKLVCLDLWSTGGPFLDQMEHIDSSGSEGRFRNNMARAPNNERVTAIKGDSLLSLSGLIAAGGTSTFDVIYVDGSHSMDHVLADAILSFRLLKVGGFLIFDDMMNFPGVKRATTPVLEALEGEDCCLEVLHDEALMVARKTAEDPWITPASVMTMGKSEESSLLSSVAALLTTGYTV